MIFCHRLYANAAIHLIIKHIHTRHIQASNKMVTKKREKQFVAKARNKGNKKKEYWQKEKQSIFSFRQHLSCYSKRIIGLVRFEYISKEIN